MTQVAQSQLVARLDSSNRKRHSLEAGKQSLSPQAANESRSSQPNRNLITTKSHPHLPIVNMTSRRAPALASRRPHGLAMLLLVVLASSLHGARPSQGARFPAAGQRAKEQPLSRQALLSRILRGDRSLTELISEADSLDEPAIAVRRGRGEMGQQAQQMPRFIKFEMPAYAASRLDGSSGAADPSAAGAIELIVDPRGTAGASARHQQQELEPTGGGNALNWLDYSFARPFAPMRG